ncbi:MAG TPA: response regulator [Candidatus Dormibacteraeota bacterium]|nr:response regulator [Candidatus Dormibacteraeota bacterium]HEV2475762.1 response regulator [Candidatus Dormibacteraeota bacterium]
MSPGEIVLLIEDNEANSMLATAVLEREGFHVEVAASAAEANRLLRAVTPAVILMDIQLPGEDGLTYTRKLKAGGATSRIPIVALTAHAMEGDRERALEAGCAGYVSKPIDTRTFAAQVREVLDGSHGFVQEEGAAS